jgi:hypothetical protein
MLPEVLKRANRIWAATLFFAIPSLLSAQTAAPLRVLFIGNSYTYYNNMPELVEAMGRSPESARPIQVKAVTEGGATLEKLWSMRGTRYAVTDSRWDAVVVQEQSTRPIRAPDLMQKTLTEIDATVRQSGARTLLYMTWSRRGVVDTQTAITEAYRSAAQTLTADLAPVGLAWHRSLAQYPHLDLYAADGSHPSPAGSYLAACVIYMALVKTTQACPELTVVGVSAEAIKQLRLAAIPPT